MFIPLLWDHSHNNKQYWYFYASESSKTLREFESTSLHLVWHKSTIKKYGAQPRHPNQQIPPLWSSEWAAGIKGRERRPDEKKFEKYVQICIYIYIHMYIYILESLQQYSKLKKCGVRIPRASSHFSNHNMTKLGYASFLKSLYIEAKFHFLDC